MSTASGFPSRLIGYRKRRGFSQLQLAAAANCSQRHVSFLELGRTEPSREMVHRLSDALGLTLRQSNELLVAAGFAPIWSETPFDSETLAPIRVALDFMLTQQEPYPAVVVDRRWNLLQANKGALALVEFLVGRVQPGAAVNLADALLAPDALRPHLVNWPEVARYFLRSVEADAAADGTPETAALHQRLLTYEGVADVMTAAPVESPAGPVLPMRFERNQIVLNLFTTIATLGTPQDITLQEVRIESFFPMDDATKQAFERWARTPKAN
jgi:transcriptional regulator with XRE-family HTH domain